MAIIVITELLVEKESHDHRIYSRIQISQITNIVIDLYTCVVNCITFHRITSHGVAFQRIVTKNCDHLALVS